APRAVVEVLRRLDALERPFQLRRDAADNEERPAAELVGPVEGVGPQVVLAVAVADRGADGERLRVAGAVGAQLARQAPVAAGQHPLDAPPPPPPPPPVPPPRPPPGGPPPA